MAFEFLSEIGKGIENIAVGAIRTLGDFDIANRLIDSGAQALGISDPVKNVAKVVGGVVFFDPVVIANGALGLWEELNRCPPAKTEYAPPATRESCGNGWAKPGQRSTLVPPGLGFNWPTVREPSFQGSSPAAASAEGDDPEELSSGAGPEDFESGAAWPVDPNLNDYLRALKVLQANWRTFDTAVGARDGLLSRENLRAVVDNPAASEVLKGASRFLLDHAEYYHRLEMAAGIGGPDRIVGVGDVSAAIAEAEAVLRRYPADSTWGPSSLARASGVPHGVRSILDSSSMSLEEKVEAVLQLIAEQTDDQISEVMDQMAQVSQRRAGLGQGTNARKSAAAMDQSMERLQLRLQKLIERRRQMFELMSTLSEKSNEMAKTAIQNMGRA